MERIKFVKSYSGVVYILRYLANEVSSYPYIDHPMPYPFTPIPPCPKGIKKLINVSSYDNEYVTIQDTHEMMITDIILHFMYGENNKMTNLNELIRKFFSNEDPTIELQNNVYKIVPLSAIKRYERTLLLWLFEHLSCVDHFMYFVETARPSFIFTGKPFEDYLNKSIKFHHSVVNNIVKYYMNNDVIIPKEVTEAIVPPNPDNIKQEDVLKYFAAKEVHEWNRFSQTVEPNMLKQIVLKGTKRLRMGDIFSYLEERFPKLGPYIIGNIQQTIARVNGLLIEAKIDPNIRSECIEQVLNKYEKIDDYDKYDTDVTDADSDTDI